MPTINGASIAQKILNQLKTRIRRKNLSPTLAIVAVGFHEPSYFYFRKIEQTAAKIGVAVEKHLFFHHAPKEKILEQIKTLNESPRVSGILLQFPLPPHLQEAELLTAVSPAKDVDGYHPTLREALNLGRPMVCPPTYAAIREILKSTRKKLAGAKAVILTKSASFGQPLQTFLERDHIIASPVLIKDKKIPNLKKADLVITALGFPHLIQESQIKKSAIVIDLGYARKGKKMVGDCAIPAAAKTPFWITPVPNGVGPITVAMLLKNVVKLAQGQKIESRK